MRIHEPLELLAIPGVAEIFHKFREFALGGDELLAFVNGGVKVGQRGVAKPGHFAAWA